MPEFIYHLSSIQLFVFLNVILLSISIGAITLVRRHIPLDFRYEENTAIVSCSALLGIIYAILIGFTILYQMNAFDATNKAENAEGRILYNIYRNAAYMPNTDGAKVRTLVLDYTQNAIQNEWPALMVGKPVDSKGKLIIEQIEQMLGGLNLQEREAAATKIIVQDLNTLFELHHERVSKIHTTLSGHLWFVILLATFITLGINFLLGMDYRLHLFCSTLISVVIATILYLLIGLDRPYQGDFVIPPDNIASLIEFAEDSGTKWADAHLTTPLLPISFTR